SKPMTWQPSSRLSKTSSAIDPPPRPGVLILASYSKALTTKSSGAAKRCVGSACGRNDPNRSAELGELEWVTERGDIVATVSRNGHARRQRSTSRPARSRQGHRLVAPSGLLRGDRRGAGREQARRSRGAHRAQGRRLLPQQAVLLDGAVPRALAGVGTADQHRPRPTVRARPFRPLARGSA